MTNTENIKSLLWKTTPQHKVYNWLKNANENGYDYIVIAYNKINFNFVPIMCHNIEEAHIWASYFSKNQNYASGVFLQSVSDQAIENIFISC